MSPVEGAHSLAHVTRMVAGAKNAPTMESPGTLPLEMSKGGNTCRGADGAVVVGSWKRVKISPLNRGAEASSRPHH